MGQPAIQFNDELVMSDFTIHVETENSARRPVHAPSDLKTEEFLDELVPGLGLPRKDENGDRLPYRLEFQETRHVLDPQKTLEENGVRAGDTLLLRVQSAEKVSCPHCGAENALGSKFCRRCGKAFELPPSFPEDLRVLVHFKDGSSRSVEAPADLKTGELVGQLTGAPAPSDGSRPTWTLYDKDTGRDLDLDKTLAENNVASGHHLYLRKVGRVFPVWQLLAGVAVLAVICGIGILLYASVWNRISVSPVTASLSVSEHQQFTTAGGARQRVRWTLSPQLGTITQDGLYTAPRVIQTSQRVTIRATSLDHPGTSAAAEVELRPSEFAVAVGPETATLTGGETVKFGAIVSGGSNTDVRWSLEPAMGSISEDGVYRAPSPVPSDTAVAVIATSEADPSKFGRATVTLRAVTISLVPERSEAKAAASVRFNASIGGSPNHGVSWSTTGPGYISKNGVYFAPQAISEAKVVTIIAASSMDPTKTARAIVKLVPVVNVTVHPEVGSLSASQRVHLTVSVSGTTNPAVRWSISGAGTVSQNGDYVAPSSIQAEQNASVTATSEADPGKSATAIITLRPIAVSLTPAGVELKAAQTWNFTAKVQGTSNDAVRWSLAGRGTLTQDGVFVAPTSIPVEQVARVTATSVVDPSRSATATVTLKPYSGPTTGVLLWSGHLEKNGTVTIDDAGASRGEVRGNRLPGLPVQISLDNNREFAVEQAPGPANGWKRLTIRSTKGKSSNVRITWSVVSQ
jgi:WXG100 protein secretion system (Wss), protein YukD/zinc-ribbon domain